MTNADTFTAIVGLRELNARAGDKPNLERLAAVNGATVVRISFTAGQVLAEHKAQFPILVQCVVGEIALSIGAAHPVADGVQDADAADSASAGVSPAKVSLVPGTAVHIEAGVVHQLEAHTDAVVTLLILR